MAHLAIKGHTTRGKEIIEILEMLGGKNQNIVYSGKDTFHYYFIDNETGYIRTKLYTDDYWTKLTYNIFTLEEFLEKFPYKVGDRVRIPEYESEVCISKMYWDGNEVQYEVVTDEVEWYSAKELNEFNEPNKEETMEIPEKLMPKIDFNEYCKDKYILDLGNYEIKEENGKTYAVRKWLEYPKTYEECCDVLGRTFPINDDVEGYKWPSILSLQILLVCRDAYWKIAGEEMGLDKPWEQDYNDRCFIIANNKGNVHTYEYHGNNNIILAFPTAEMRDAFYKNFKDFIEKCKELL